MSLALAWARSQTCASSWSESAATDFFLVNDSVLMLIQFGFFKKKWAILSLFFVYFRSFSNNKFKFHTKLNLILLFCCILILFLMLYFIEYFVLINFYKDFSTENTSYLLPSIASRLAISTDNFL